MSNTVKRYTKAELTKALDLHAKWTRREPGGVWADLSCVNLSGANLRNADLSGANLSGANLSGVNLSGANLLQADLFQADLSGVNLSGADLSGVNLSGADLSGADLSGVNLSGVNLSGANLYGADLSRTYYLSEANLLGALLPEPIIDLSGCKVGFKKVWNSDRSKQVVVELRFPEGTKLVSTVIGRKCRASEAVVGRCLSPGYEAETLFWSMHDDEFAYEVGETVRPTERFDDSPLVECTSGIHFFVTRKEAEEYAC